MASPEFEGMFAPTPAAQPDQPQDALPPPQQGGNEFSGMFDATLAAKARAAGTTASPKDAGSALTDGVRTGTPPEVIKADPAAFKKNQQDKAAAEAIDNDPDVAHYINSVPDGAAISADDWRNLAHVAKEAAKAFQPVWEQFADRWISGPAIGQAKAGLESILQGIEDVKQAHRDLEQPSAYDLMPSNAIARTIDHAKSAFHIGLGALEIGTAWAAPAVSAFLDVTEKLGIPRDEAIWALMGVGARAPGRGVASVDPTVRQGKPTGRDLRERTAAYYEEYTPSEIKTWSDSELNKYVNQKMGFGSAASDLAEVRQPKPGVDKGFDQIHVGQANVNSESLDALVDAVQTSKTKEMSPAAMEAWLNLKGLGAKNVWLDAKMAAEVYGSEAPAVGDNKLGWISGLEERLPEAAELGSEISVPLSRYLANIDPGVHSQFKDLARVDEGLNMQEAKEWIKAWHDDYVKDAEAEDIANMHPEKNPEERLPSNSKPQEYGVDNFLPPVAEQGKMPRQAPKTPTSPAAQTYPNERVYNAGLKIVLDSGQASTPFIQRELGKQGVNLTYQQANQLMAVLEKRGIVGPHEEGGTRAVLVGKNKTPPRSFEAMKQEITAKPGANTARLAKLLGPKLYGEPTHMDKVTVKELLQNAADAVDAAVEKGQIKKGQIFLSLDRDNRVIKMTDNGTGMAPETLAKEFLEIAGTKKESLNPKGGFGIAKMLVNFANKGLHVMTMRDGKVSELHTHGEELFAALEDPSLAPKVTIRAPTAEDKFFFPDGHGTHIEVTIPENYKDSQTGEMKAIAFDTFLHSHPGLTRSPLFGSKVSVIMDRGAGVGMESLPMGENFPVDNFTQFPPAKFNWGTAQIYVSKAPKKENFSWEDNIHFLSNGIWQYSDKIKINPLDWASGNIPHDFYIDLHPKVKPEDAGYPFDLNRQGLTRDAKRSMDQILNYLSKTYQQLDFAAQAKSYGAISYLTPGKGGVQVSKPSPLEPKIPPSKTSMTGLKETDVIEFKGDDMYVNGKKMPSMTKDDLAKATLNIDELMIDPKMIRPDQVMMHSSMETRAPSPLKPLADQIELTKIDERSAAIEKRLDELEEAGGAGFNEWEKLVKEKMDLAIRSEAIRHKSEDVWIPLDEAARQKFGPAFDEFMYDVGQTFLRLRDGIVALMGKEYQPLLKEAIGISFDPTYRGVSIRVPFSGSFINPAVPQFADDPIRAAVGTFGTMVHELAHHKVRSHNADFPAEMQKIQIYLDMAQIMNNTNVNTNYINRQGMINALAQSYKKHWEIFKWLNERVTSKSLSRTRGRRIKGTDEPAGEGLFAGNLGRGGIDGIGPLSPQFQKIEGEGPRPTQSGEIHSPNAQGRGFLANETEQLAQVLLHAEKRDLYLATIFKDAKSAGMTQKAFNAWSKRLQEVDEADYEKALAAAHKEVARTLTPEWQKEFNEIYNEVETDFRSNPQIAANNFFRTGKLPTGEVRSPLPKLDKDAVGYMTNADLSAVTAKGGTHPDDAAMMFSMGSGRELVQALADFDRARGRNTVDKHLKDLITEEANKRMADRHGDIRDRIAEKAQEIAVENHHIDILIEELKQLAKISGQIPFTIEQIKDRVDDLFNRVPHTEAKFSTYQRAVFKAGRQAENYLLEGKVDKAFKAKQTQLFAVLAAKKARSFESYKRSNENSFDRIAKNETLGGVEQPYTDFASDILAGLGYMEPRPHLDHGKYEDFLTEHNGSIASAYWITDPREIRKIDGKPVTYEQLNTEEFTALAKTIQSVLHNGREAKKINTLFGKADLDNALFDLTQTMLRWPDKAQPKGIFGIRGGLVRGAINYVNAAHMLVERMMDYADAFKRGGPFSTYIDRPMREAYNEEIKLQEATVKKLKYIRDKYVDSSIYDSIDNREILDPLNGNKPMQLSRWNLRQIWGYLGSKVGRDKLTQGYGITPDQAYTLVIRNATEQDAQYVNSMWELHDDLWKRAAVKEERRTGVPVDAREPMPHKLNLASGATVNMTGGYQRLVYDRDLSSIQQDLGLKGDMFEAGYTPAITTPHAYTISPTKYVGRLDLTASMEAAKISGMIHDIAFRDVVLDVRKLLMSKAATAEGGFRDVSKRKWGVYMDRLWDGWLKDIANSHLVEDDFLRDVSRALAIMRQNVVGSLIFLKPSVAVKHGLTAMGMSTSQVGPKAMVSGIYDIGTAGMRGALRDLVRERGMEPDPAFAAAFQRIAKPGKRGAAARAFIYNSSPMMRARRRQYKNSIRGAMEALEGIGWRRGLVDARQVSLSIGRMAVAMSDALSADAEWTGAYSTHFRETGDHDEAVNIADRAVTRAHGSSFVGDRSAILRSKNEFVRNTALLFSYWNHYMVNMIQLGWDIGARFSRGAGSEPGANIPSISARIAYLMVLATIADTISETLFTHNKHPLWLRGLMALGRQIGSGYYGVRELVNVALGYEPAAGAFGIMMRNLASVAKDAYREITTGKSSGRWLTHLTDLIGAASGIGGGQVGATATGVANLLSGDQQPEDTQEFIKQMATGFSRVPRRR